MTAPDAPLPAPSPDEDALDLAYFHGYRAGIESAVKRFEGVEEYLTDICEAYEEWKKAQQNPDDEELSATFGDIEDAIQRACDAMVDESESALASVRALSPDAADHGDAT